MRNLIATTPNLAGTTLSLDAIHCNPESSREICEDAQAHYMMGVKNNQKQLLNDVESMFALSEQPADSSYSEEKGHGRVESRMVELLPVESSLGLPYARTAVRVHRTRTPVRNGKRGKTKSETAYFLTSLSLHTDKLSAEKAGKLIRGHWNAIENGLHHIKDATLLEDRYRANNGLARIIAAMRSLATLIFRPLKYSTKVAMRKVAGNLHYAVRLIRSTSLDKVCSDL